MKKYLLFSGKSYYANGGILDFKGSFDSLEDAVAKGRYQLDNTYEDWFHVYDSESNIVKAYIDGSCCGNVTGWVKGNE